MKTLHYTHLILALLCLLRPASSDFASDEAECADQLMGLTTCLNYVEGSANAPTPDCCSSSKTVVSKSSKCLCILVKDHDNPQLGFKINVTRALNIPTACNVPFNVSDCPKLLNLPPNSPDAQIFNQFANTSAKGSSEAKGGGGKPSTILPSPQTGSAVVHASSSKMKHAWWGRRRLEMVLLQLMLPLVVLTV